MTASSAIIAGELSGGSYAFIPAIMSVIIISMIIFVMYLKRIGHFKFNRIDWIGLSLCLLGIILWRTQSNPLIAIVIASIVEIIGSSLVLIKLTKDKGSELPWAWLVTGFCYLIPFFNADHFSFTNSLYGFSVSFMCLLIGFYSMTQLNFSRRNI